MHFFFFTSINIVQLFGHLWITFLLQIISVILSKDQCQVLDRARTCGCCNLYVFKVKSVCSTIKYSFTERKGKVRVKDFQIDAYK